MSSMSRGSATIDQQFAYFIPNGNRMISRYEWSTKIWKKPTQCIYNDAALVTIEGALTAVGGSHDCIYSAKVLTLRGNQWFEDYPPMNTARSCAAVVSTSDGNIVALGGKRDNDWVTTVELLQAKSKRWHELTQLPEPLSSPSAAICGNQLYVIGEAYGGYSCSLQPLLSSKQPMTSSPIITWTPLPCLPVAKSTAATLRGQLVIVGGTKMICKDSKSIHQLVDGLWVRMGSMCSTRHLCLVASPSPHKLMIVGGTADDPNMEECSVV